MDRILNFITAEFFPRIADDGIYALRMVIACFCGALIGLERSRRQKDAGIRTHIMVALGSALTIIVSKYGFFDVVIYDGISLDASRIAASVTTGVSFLGAGVIFVRDVSIKGLTTAAGIWTTAAVGLAIGSGLYTVGICATALMIFFQLIMHKFFSRLENTVNEFSVTVNNSPKVVSNFRAKLKQNNITVEKCKMTRNPDQTITLDITIKKARTTSMDEIMLIADNDENIISVDI